MEYEYSYKVSNIDEYVKYCKDNNYEYIGFFNQERIIYKSSNGTIARITIDNEDKKLDFKEDILSSDDLIERKESKEIVFDDISNCENILKFLGYKKNNRLIRERYIYQKDNVKFEIDNYLDPKEMVVAIEGDKKQVDIVYSELEKTLNKKYKKML